MGLYAGFSVGVKMNNFLNTFSVGAYANLLLTVIGQVVIQEFGGEMWQYTKSKLEELM